MASIGTLAVNIVARTEKFSKGVTRAIGTAGGFKKAMVGIGVATTAAIAVTTRLAATYDQLSKSMNASLAIMNDISATMRGQMVGAALEVSRTTRFAAKDAAEAYFFLASAGLDASQALAAMPKVAAFAQAGNFDLALATDLATDAQSALGLTSKDAAENLAGLTRVTDALIKANTLANASAQQFSEALTNKAGAALRLVNKDIEEGLAVLAAYADQGIKGAEAGTALGIVMRDLQTKALQNASAFRRNGIAVYDWFGNMRRLPLILRDIEKRLDGMSDAQAKATLLAVGFSDKSVAYIQTLIGLSSKIEGYEKALRSAGGITEQVAAKQMTPMEKLLARLRSRWEEMAVAIGPAVDAVANWAIAILDAESAAAKLEGRMSSLSRFALMIADTFHDFGVHMKGAKAIFWETLADITQAWASWEKDIKAKIRELAEMAPWLFGEANGKLQGGMEVTIAEDFRRIADSARDTFRSALMAPTPSEMAAAAMKKAQAEQKARDTVEKAEGGKRSNPLIANMNRTIKEWAAKFGGAGNKLRDAYFQQVLSDLTFGLFGKRMTPAAVAAAQKSGNADSVSNLSSRSINSALQYGSREAAVASRQRNPMLGVAKDQLKVLRDISRDTRKRASAPTVMLAELNL